MKKLLLCLTVMLLFSFKASAHDIPESFLDSLPFDAGSGGIEDIEKGRNDLWAELTEKIKAEAADGLGKSLKILIICGICALAGVIQKSGENIKGERIVEITGVCLLLAISLADTKNIILESRETISEIGVFSKILLPLLAMWASCAGKPMSAVGITGGAMVYTNLCCALAEKLIFALIIVYILLKTAGVLGENHIASGIADGMKNVLFYAVKLCLMGVSFYMTLSGCIMSAGDSVAIKTTKAAVSVLPGVGSAVAGVTESVIAGAGIIRNSVGVLGVLAVLFFALGTFVRLFVNMVIFKMIGVVGAAFTSGMLAKTIDTIGNGYAMALGMLAAASAGVIMAVALCVSVFGG